MGVRGVGVGAPRRDGFAGTFGTGTGMNSLFDIERADVVRGPQGLLYGASGAGGTVNIVSKRANFNRTYGRANFRIDQHGSKQALLDYNWGA
jgi:outer membrane receptor protein involved in Fe transport